MAGEKFTPVSQEERDKWRQEHATELEKAQSAPSLEIDGGGGLSPEGSADDKDLEGRHEYRDAA